MRRVGVTPTLLVARPFVDYFGWAGEVILILPEMMSDLIWSSSFFRSLGTLESNWWNGARPTPSFFSVPM